MGERLRRSEIYNRICRIPERSDLLVVKEAKGGRPVFDGSRIRRPDRGLQGALRLPAYHQRGRHPQPVRTTIIHEENQSAIALADSETTTRRSKHVDVKYHYIRDEVTKGAVTVHYVPSEENCADIFRKALSQPLFSRHAKNLIMAAKIEEDVDVTVSDPACQISTQGLGARAS